MTIEFINKWMVLTDAVAICYCWMLLNVEQSSYGATEVSIDPGALVILTNVSLDSIKIN